VAGDFRVKRLNYRDLIDAYTAFLETVRAVFGVYFDGTRGFNLVHKQQLDTRDALTHMQGRDAEYWDSRPFVYGSHADPEHPDAMPLHSVTYGELTARNNVGGENWTFLANVCLVSIYQYWEDRYRQDIAAALAMQKNDLRVPVMGDLRHYRNSIIHHGGVAIPAVARCELLHWFGPGQRIELSQEHMREIMFMIVESLVELLEQADDGTGTLTQLLRQSSGGDLGQDG
jgi:hypothetical protein